MKTNSIKYLDLYNDYNDDRLKWNVHIDKLTIRYLT